MENIILTNNKDLRLVSVKVGVLSTLRFELPLVSASATHVEVIVTSGSVHSAYTATFIDATKRWQCDIAASQFPAVGKQSYEVAYVLDGKQFWDGKGWIEIEDATTSGIEPQPRPEPYRYTVLSVNGYGADAQGAVRIPMTFIATDSPATTEGYIEGDIYFNRVTGATWTLCNVLGTLTWVFNYKNYYTKEETDQQIDRVAAYYITSDAQGNPFSTRAALINAMAYYSGGQLRTPTRNDYAVVLADEAHGGAEWRYIYAVADGQTTGQWEAQYPVEGAIVADDNVTKTSTNPVKSSGIWAAIWGALSAIPSGFTSLYDWVVAQLGLKRAYTDLSYNTQVTVNAPALHAILTSRGTQILEYYLPCTEDIPATPQINHVYTWRRDGAEFYITQGVSAFSTIWTLFGSEGEQLASTTTDNATQGYFSDLTFETSAYSTVTSTKVNSYPDEVRDTLALDSNIPNASTALPSMDSPNGAVVGTSTSYARGDHVHPTDTSRVPTSRTINSKALTSDVTLTANDIDYSVPGGAQSVQMTLQGIEATLAGKQSALTAQQLANIAAVSDALAFDATHSYAVGDPVVYNGTLYTFTAAHTGTWTGSDVSAVDIIARLAGKLDKTGGTVTGDLEVVYTDYGFKVKNTSGDYLQIRHDTVAGNFWYIDYSVANVGSGSLRLPYENIIPADIYSLAGSFDTSTTYTLNSLCVGSQGVLYRCINPNGHTGAWVAADFAVATVEDVLAALRTAIAGKADVSAIPYALVTKTISNNAVTLDDRAANAVTISATLSPNTLTINFPTATSGKVRDFAMRLNVAAGVTAPEIAWPQGVTLENNGGEVPEIADGGTGGSSTILYFSETENDGTTAKFLVKGETLTAITQA